MSKNTAIVIPVYKPQMTNIEMSSFKNCLYVLSKRDIYIITHNKVKLELYKSIAKDYNHIINIEYFEENFFKDIEGYNRLLLTKEFYNRFARFDYILIHQLDAYIFDDKLDYWTNKGYDYVGAPWFENFKSHEDGYNLWSVGNGGFSLRNISYYSKLLSSRHPIKKVNLLEILRSKNLKNFIHYIKYALGENNTINYYIKHRYHNEDVLLSVFLVDSWIPPYLPSPEEAAFFAFECSPEYLYKTVTNKSLPMGCHAFESHEFNSFWKLFINI